MSENNRCETIWSYFDKVDKINKEAQCKLCNNLYKYGGTSYNLKSHLKHKHSDIFSRIRNMDVAEKRRANGTEVWTYFKPIDLAKKVASCNACKKSISYKTTSANLKTHLRRMHKDLYAEMMGEDECEEVYLEEDESDSQDEAWSFFERERAGAEARCVVCRALVPRARAALRDHLRAHHPKLLENPDSGEETNNTQEDVYTEIVYLENEENPKKTPKTAERPRKSRKAFTEIKKRKISSSSDEEPLKLKKIRNDDEIEQFAKYVTCLLKKVPRETSMELQMEIINLIMKKQLEMRSEPASKVTEVKDVEGAGQTRADCVRNGCPASEADENEKGSLQV